MNSDNWPPCIVTAFDLVGTRSAAPSGQASSAMIQMHRLAVEKINAGLPNHSYGYVWNDSVLLLSYIDKPAAQRRTVLNELSEFKHALDTQCGKAYAISVMGLAFPHDKLGGNIATQSRAVVLRTSSWAMANCFHIEEKLGRHRADWYIDSRITNNISLPPPFVFEKLKLMPQNELRTVNMYKGYFHQLNGSASIL